MIPRFPYRPLSASECGVCCDGLGFRTRPCPGCGKQKPSLAEIERERAYKEERRQEAEALQREYLERWGVKFRAQEARRVKPREEIRRAVSLFVADQNRSHTEPTPLEGEYFEQDQKRAEYRAQQEGRRGAPPDTHER